MTTIIPSVDTLLAARNRILELRDLEYNPDTRAIDAVLATVPPGVDNRVDLALGRLNATLPERCDYGLRANDIAEMQACCAETWRGEDYDEREGSVI
jgi:hypothetical protein